MTVIEEFQVPVVLRQTWTAQSVSPVRLGFMLSGIDYSVGCLIILGTAAAGLLSIEF